MLVILFGQARPGGAPFRPELGKSADKRVDHARPEGKEMKFSLPRDLDQAGGLEFLDVVRESGGGKKGGGGEGGGRPPGWCAGKSLPEVKTPWVGEGL